MAARSYEKLKTLTSPYSLQAKFYPAIVCALPVFVLLFFLAGDAEIKRLGQFLLSLRFYGGITVGIVALYFYAQVIRFAAKLLEASYFAEGLGFPTVYLMTYADQTYSRSYKDRYRTLVKQDFGIDLLNETEEVKDPAEAKKRLREITKHIILKVGPGQLVLKHNIWYGFIRNSIGGACFAILFCIMNVGLGLAVMKSNRLAMISVVLAVPYVFLVLLSKPLLKQNAEAYAKQLIAEYSSSPHGVNGR